MPHVHGEKGGCVSLFASELGRQLAVLFAFEGNCRRKSVREPGGCRENAATSKVRQVTSLATSEQQGDA